MGHSPGRNRRVGTGLARPRPGRWAGSSRGIGCPVREARCSRITASAASRAGYRIAPGPVLVAATQAWHTSRPSDGGPPKNRDMRSPAGRRKATRSSNNTACVEVGRVAGGAAVRDTEDRAGGHLTATAHQRTSFLTALQHGRNDS